MNRKSVEHEILENTLGAVRKRKAQRKRNRATLAMTSVLLAVVVLALAWQKTDPPEDASSRNVAADSSDLVTPSDQVQIDIAVDGSIESKSISLEELAKIVYNPSLKFSRTHDTFTWKGDYKVIHMRLPQTSMAITDTFDESL
ncbi:hypothetical protein NT6N_37170 [Oceaniferula spumae]|uniref:Uncharacterized protein n=1 Tax=Oceaniferula spumae TaxID=2979115 RepID=A0AAT9FR91_9BACT